MSTEIWVALIGLGGIIWTTTVAFFLSRAKRQKDEINSKDARIDTLKNEQAFERKAINTFVNLQQWDTIAARIQSFCRDTSIDRFMILVAVNGASDPKETTAIYQHRQDSSEFQSYVGIDLDRDYISRLADLKKLGVISVRTADLPSCLIRDIYEAEGVQYALWYLIGTMVSHETGQVAYKYCSFATHEEIIDEKTQRSVANIVGELKKLMGKTSYRAY